MASSKAKAKAGGVDEANKQEKRKKVSVLAYRFWKTFGPSYRALNALNCFSFPFLPRSKHYILGTVLTWSKTTGLQERGLEERAVVRKAHCGIMWQPDPIREGERQEGQLRGSEVV